MQADKIRNIEEIYQASHDEYARGAFISAFRKYVMVDMREGLRSLYDHQVEPAYIRKKGQAPETGAEVRSVMKHVPYFQFWSAFRYNAQTFVWDVVADGVERALPDMIAVATDAANRRPSGGSLRLTGLPTPKYVSAMDIHHMPGSFHSEFAKDDVAQGARYNEGVKVYSGGLKHRQGGTGPVALSIAQWLSQSRPHFKPLRILDLGCSTGGNLLPYRDVFLDAELYGVDVSAPLLRYAHAIAEYKGVKTHFSQQDAESLDFDDASFDLVTSSFFFHELPVAVTRRILREVRRVLKPGAIMAHMELPPHSAVDPYYNFYLDWDNFYNNEPNYMAFRRQNVRELLVDAGFSAARCFETLIPNYRSFGEERFSAFIRGELPAPTHGNGASWFVFGAEA